MQYHGVLAVERDSPTGWLIDPPIGPLARPPGGPSVGSLPAVSTGRLTGSSPSSLAALSTGRLTGLLSGSLAGWLACWLSGSPAGWSTGSPSAGSSSLARLLDYQPDHQTERHQAGGEPVQVKLSCPTQDKEGLHRPGCLVAHEARVVKCCVERDGTCIMQGLDRVLLARGNPCLIPA